MKAARMRALLFLAGLMLIVWGILPRYSLPASAAPNMVVTETPTSEPPSPTPVPPSPTAGEVNPTNTPVPPTPTAPPPSPVPPTATNTPEPPTDEDEDEEQQPTATAAPSAIPEPSATPAPSATPTAAPAAPVADPAITKSVSPGVAAVGDTVVYTIQVTNLGGAPATGVTVDDTLPSFLALVDAQATRGVVTTTERGVRVEIGDLAPGEMVEVRVSARVLAAATPPNNRNLATVTSTSPDSNAANNQASVPVDTVVPVPAALPRTSDGPGAALPLLAATLGLALIAGSALLRSGARRR